MPPSKIDRHDFYVYGLLREDLITCFYVGKGRGKRVKMHEYYAIKGRKSHKDNIIRKMIAKGISIPIVIFSENLSDEEAKQLEINLIKCIGRAPHGPLTNQTAGGEGLVELSPEALERKRRALTGRKASVETIEKIRAAASNPSAQTRAKMSAAAKGKVLSEITKQRQSAAHKGQKRTPEQREHYRAAMLRRPRETFLKSAEKRRGMKHSEETKALLSQALKGRTASPETRAKMSEAHRNISPETRAKMSVFQKNRPRGPRSEETRDKLRAARAKQAPMSAEARAKISAALRARPPISEETRAKRRASILRFLEEKRRN